MCRSDVALMTNRRRMAFAACGRVTWSSRQDDIALRSSHGVAGRRAPRPARGANADRLPRGLARQAVPPVANGSRRLANPSLHLQAFRAGQAPRIWDLAR